MALQGLGTKASPYLVQTASDLSEVNNNLSAHYLQTADIILPTGASTNANNHNVIGTSSSAFTGVYDGGGYRILNMKLLSSNGYLGMFAKIGGTSSSAVAEVKNLIIEDARVEKTSTNVNYYIGVLAGFIAIYSSIKNVEIRGGLVLSTTNTLRIGGLAGIIYGSSHHSYLNIENVGVWDTEIRSSNEIGGIASQIHYTTLKNVFAIPSLPISHERTYSFSYTHASSHLTNCSGNSSTSGSSSTTRLQDVTSTSGKTRNHYSYVSDYYGWAVSVELSQTAFWNMDGDGENYPYLTFIGQTSKNAYPIATTADFEIMKANMSGYYRLTTNVPAPALISSGNYLFGGNFSGELDGDGFSMTDISIVNTVSGNKSVFELVSGTIKNIQFEATNITSNTLTASGVTQSLTGTLRDVRVIVSGTITGGNFYYACGLVGLLGTGATVERCYFDGSLRVGSTSGGSGLCVIGNGGASSITIKNNIARLRTLSGGQTRRYIGKTYNSGLNTGTFQNNVYHATVAFTTDGDYGAIRVFSINDFQNPNYSGYNNFDKVNDWKMELGKDPIQYAFIKVLTKIQQEIVKAYSRISTSKTERFISKLLNTVSFVKKSVSKNSKIMKVLKNVDSFTQDFNSKLSVTKNKLKSMKAFSKKILSETSSKKKANKQTTSFTGRITGQSISEAVRRTFIQIASFAEKMIGDTTKQKKQSKLKKGFIKPFESHLTMKKKVGRMIKAFSESIKSNVIRNVSVSIFVKGFVDNIKSSSFAELFRKRVAQVTSHTGIIISRIRRFSNIYKFAKMTVNSGVKAIVSNVSKTNSVKRMVESYMKSFSSRSIYTFILASAKNVMAIISHRFNQVRLYKHENETDVNTRKHATKINIKDDGGEG